VLAATIRSGLIESTHPWSAVVVDTDGQTYGQWGDPGRPLYYRSAVKAFQATVSQEWGAALPPEHLALACASHSGTPAHVAIVRAMLEEASLDETALRCPFDVPLGQGARRRAIAAGEGRKRIYHNCSGKHTGFLRASAARGLPLATYLSPDHPLQQKVSEVLIDVTGVDGLPPGVDGCGAPTLRGNLRGLARAFAHLSVAPRFEEVRTAMTRYPALTSGNERSDGRFAMWWDGPAKGGAEGLMAAGRHGIGIATKSHGGSGDIAVQAMIEIVERLGLLPPPGHIALEDVHRRPVFGGGDTVGHVIAACDRAQP
jgi:L-asparaginase II